nr:hypothetical protein [Nonomuraea basaltis]
MVQLVLNATGFEGISFDGDWRAGAGQMPMYGDTGGTKYVCREPRD